MERAARIGLETLGMLMIGDGLVTALHPRRHARLWETGPEGLRHRGGWTPKNRLHRAMATREFFDRKLR